MDVSPLTSLLPASISAVAILGVRKKRAWGPLTAVGASLAWVIYGLLTAQVGIVLSELLFGGLYMATFLEWTRNGY